MTSAPTQLRALDTFQPGCVGVCVCVEGGPVTTAPGSLESLGRASITLLFPPG